MSVDSTDELDKVLDSIWAYGVDWTEHKDESEHDLKVSTYAAKIKKDMKQEFKAALQSLIEDRVREAVELFRSDITGWDFDTMVDDDQDSRQICEMVESCSAQTADYVLDTLQLSNSKDSK